MLYHISATVKPLIIQFKTSCSLSKRLNFSFDSICISDFNIGSPFNSILSVGSGYIFVIYSIFSYECFGHQYQEQSYYDLPFFYKCFGHRNYELSYDELALLFVDFETYTITIVLSLATHVIGTPVNSSVG